MEYNGVIVNISLAETLFIGYGSIHGMGAETGEVVKCVVFNLS